MPLPAGRVTEVDDTPTPGPGPGPGPGPALADPLRAPTDPSVPLRLHGIEAAKVHGTLLAVLVLCSLAFRFELVRALGGNGLSWAYVFEWPLFAAFGAYMWWTVLRGGRSSRKNGRNPGTRPAPNKLDPKYAGMLKAWQAHQRDLQASQAEAEGRDAPGSTTSG